MEDLKIQLTYDPEYFRDIYYKNGQGSMFTYKPTQKAIIYFLSTALLIYVVYLLAFQYPVASWLILLALIGLIFTAINAGILIVRYLRWKLDAEAFIRGLAKYKSFSIELTAGGITFTQDSTITIDKWDSMKSVTIFENYLMLSTKTEPSYFIPARSMKPTEFIKLKDFITKKMKIEEKE